MRPWPLALAAALLLVPAGLAAGPRPEANSYLVADGRTGEVLLAHEARRQVPIASITKLMTVLLTIEHTRLEDTVTVSSEAVSVGESSVHLHTGESLSVRDLLEAALIQSANDAAWALAVHVGHGSEERFVGLMNRRARELGLADTHFTRPDGLDAQSQSSARDVTMLARIVMKKRPVRRIVAMSSATIAGGRTLHTWNDLLGTFPGLVGVKTGHTGAAGWSEVAAARGSGVVVYATLLGSPSRETRNGDLAELLTWGLARYRVVSVVSPDRVYARVETPFGRGDLDLVAPRRLRRAVLASHRLVERVIAPIGVDLPVQRGETLGEVRVFDRGRLVARSPLVASRSLSKPGALGRAGWYAGRTAHNMWRWVS